MGRETLESLLEKAARLRQEPPELAPDPERDSMRQMMREILAMPVSEFNELLEKMGEEPIDLKDLLIEGGTIQIDNV